MKKLRNITSQLVVAAIVVALLSTNAYGWFNTISKESVTYEIQEAAEATEYSEEYGYIENFPISSEDFDVSLNAENEYKKYFYIEEQAEYMEIVVDVSSGEGNIKLCDDEGNELKEWENVSNGSNSFIYDFSKNNIDTKRENFYIEIENANDIGYDEFFAGISYFVYQDYSDTAVVENREIPLG